MRLRVIERSTALPLPLPEAWEVISHSARMNEAVENVNFEVEERTLPDGTVRRHGRGKFFPPFDCDWEEAWGEWLRGDYLLIRRSFSKGPLQELSFELRLHPLSEAETTVDVTARLHWNSLLTDLAAGLGMFDKAVDIRVRAIRRLAGLYAEHAEIPSDFRDPDVLSPDAERRLATIRTALEAAGFEPDLIDRLVHYLRTAPLDLARGVRPLALARGWGVPPERMIGLCLEASRQGLLGLGWDLLCPRCRGAKLRAGTLADLEAVSHCVSCNIDYERDFTGNVELTFRPESWLRDLPEGEFCMQGAGSTPHVLLQRPLAPGELLDLPLELETGGYRLRTVEPGDVMDLDIDAARDTALPSVVLDKSGFHSAEDVDDGPDRRLRLRNATERTVHAVLEDRRWTKDALTGDRVIAMPVFRRLCPEQLLRPGDSVDIRHISLLFTDLLASTALYNRIGDSRAFALVRDHFEAVGLVLERHGGVLVKTMGDAVMAAFEQPVDALRAALALQQEGIAGAEGTGLKLGLNAGPCVAVTTGDVLDYFGATVNLAARLAAQSQDGEIVLPESLARHPVFAPILAEKSCRNDHASVRGFAAPVPVVRIAAAEDAVGAGPVPG